MVEREIDGRKKLCFLVKKGDVNDIVIPIDGLLAIDYKRLTSMEGEGGEMMKVMRDTLLDNGKNALALYEPLLKVVPRPDLPKVVKEDRKNETMEEIAKEDKEPVKRGRGRPKGSKTAKK